jgi:hypothetical protein
LLVQLLGGTCRPNSFRREKGKPSALKQHLNLLSILNLSRSLSLCLSSLKSIKRSTTVESDRAKFHLDPVVSTACLEFECFRRRGAITNTAQLSLVFKMMDGWNGRAQTMCSIHSACLWSGDDSRGKRFYLHAILFDELDSQQAGMTDCCETVSLFRAMQCYAM